QVDPLVDTHGGHLLHVARAGSEGEAVECVQGAPLLALADGCGTLIVIFIFLLREQRRDDARQAQSDREEKKNCGLGAAQTHEDSQPGKTASTPIINPDRKKKLLAMITEEQGCPKGKSQAKASRLSQIHLAAGHFVLQGGGQLVDVGGSDVYRHVVGQKRNSIAAHGVAANL